MNRRLAVVCILLSCTVAAGCMDSWKDAALRPFVVNESGAAVELRISFIRGEETLLASDAALAAGESRSLGPFELPRGAYRVVAEAGERRDEIEMHLDGGTKGLTITVTPSAIRLDPIV